MKGLLLSISELKWGKTDHVSKNDINFHIQIDFLFSDYYLSVYREKSWEIDNRIHSVEGVRSSEMCNLSILLVCCLFPKFYLEKLRNNNLRIRNRLA